MKMIGLVALLVSMSCIAADRNGSYSILGRGTVSCGTLLEAHERKDQYSVLFISEWVNGYLTAANRITPGVYDLTEGLDLAARSQWLLKYCRDNPLDKIAAATENLARELKGRSH